MNSTSPPNLMNRLGKRRRVKVGARTAITAIDLDGPVLLVAQSARRGEETQIVHFASRALDTSSESADSDAQSIGAAIAQGLERLRVKPGPVVMGIPRNRVMLRTLSLPAANSEAELASMVYFQISKDLPFPFEEAVIDFTVQGRSAPVRSSEPANEPENPRSGRREEAQTPLGSSEVDVKGNFPLASAAGNITVLVAIAKKDVVQHYEQVALAAGLKLISLGLGSYARARCISLCGAGKDNSGVALISLRADEITTDVVADQALLFSRTAAIAREDKAGSTDAPERPGRESTTAKEDRAAANPPKSQKEFASAVIIEVIRSLDSYEGMEARCPVAKLVVVGDTGQEAGIVRALADRLHLPCSFLDPTVALGLKSSESAPCSGAMTALGLAYGAHDAEGLPFDFLNPKRPPVLRNWGRLKLLAGAAAAVVILLTSWGVRAHLIRKHQQIKAQVQAEVTQAEKHRALYRDMRYRVKTVQDWSADRKNWLDHYAFLSALLPACTDVYITSLSTGARGTIHLAVQARSGEILAQMDKRLREAGYDLKPLAITPSSDKYGYSFQTAVELTLPSKLKIDKAKLTAGARPGDDGSLDGLKARPRPTTVESAPNPAPSSPAQPPAPEPQKPAPIVRSDPIPFQQAALDPSAPPSAVAEFRRGVSDTNTPGAGRGMRRSRRLQP